MKLIILDRDGTINHDRDDYVKSVDEWLPLPHALEAIALMNAKGYTVCVATSQSGIGRGYYSLDTFHAMTAKLQSLLAPLGGRVDSVFYCPHTPEHKCDCRKPLPGLFKQVAAHYGLTSLQGVPTVGDSLRDLTAGAAVGCSPHLVRTGKAEHSVPTPLPPGTQIHANLLAFTQTLPPFTT